MTGPVAIGEFVRVHVLDGLIYQHSQRPPNHVNSRVPVPVVCISTSRVVYRRTPPEGGPACYDRAVSHGPFFAE